MSRETDSSSSGPQGRGGAAYPSGTPPYGSRQYPSLHPQDAPDEAADAAPEPQPDEPRTETTLTTRIRINIPGSRPIPPVVMRTPMSDVDAADRPDSERTGSTPRPDVTQETAAPVAEPPAEEKAPTSDWFAPRKPGSGPGTNGAGLSTAAAQPSAPTAPAGPAGPGANGGGPGAGLPYFSDGRQGGPAQGGPGQGGPAQGGPAGPRPRSALSDLATNADGPASGASGFAPGNNTPPLGVRPPGASLGPTGPTTGPVTGSVPLGARPGGPGPAPGAPGQGPRGQGPGGQGPGPRGQGPGSGIPGGPPRMSDDTAVLTPQQPAQEPGGGHVSGDTLTSGIPVVPPDHRSPFPPLGGPLAGPGTGPNPLLPQGPGPQGPGPHGFDDGEFSAPEFAAGPGGGPAGPVVPAPAAAARPAPRSAPAKKGRSKLVLASAGVIGLLGLAYGVGLLLDHSEVPKSTTVLGVDIGGGTKADAVSKLDTALAKRAASPLQLTVGGKKEQLAPDKAGLSLDSQATVRKAAGSDYNPVSVIGSLFGGERVTEPVILVDEEKLSVALTDLAGVSGSASEGTIRFEPGKAVAVPGKAGQTLDVGRSMISVKDAYRAQVETGRPNVVQLPVATREPTITQTELDRAMKDFAEPAMSGLITIKAGGKQIAFGPAKSLPKILSMKAIDGKLVEVYDKKAIDDLLDGVFDGVLITKGDGKKHQVSADDVAQAMGTALRGRTPAERTATIELNPS
ncbi:hypothetical protein HRW23_02960 [Streptomyces lunaelactis]|uniref:hypothetical protein n=1 Tax=Streptomyces lunaelactis TaxID=1535768 RepID=UPI001584E1B0|nr:hypothetical protein [Streptomyces lunaelactis]NUK51525.1 hypothetical protein [Streptomyces lunaelactis]NUK69070.1 hypothetical protein [Streptomyces lunaelactis]NUK73379.1 hypothetical protein [Streptomyces lunaelactis]NUK76376.1 hypothetical protein [Streptomyces lunaelactis]